MTDMNRRGFLGAVLYAAAPFVIRNSSVLMPVKEIIQPTPTKVIVSPNAGINLAQIRELLMPGLRKAFVETQYYNNSPMSGLIASFGSKA